MGCGGSSSKNGDQAAKGRNQKRSTRKRRNDGGFSALEDDDTPPQLSQANPLNATPSSVKGRLSNAGLGAGDAGPLGGSAAAAGGKKPVEDDARKGSQWANTYSHILKEPTIVPQSQPVVQSVGNDSKKRPFRQVIKEALQLAKDQRAKYGKFRKDEKHTVMELYDLVGLEEDTFLGPPNELQERLGKFTYPPPNMHMLRENEMDEDVVDFMLGVEEAKKRKAGGLEVAPAKEVALKNDGGAKRRQGVSSEATSTLSRMKIFKEIPKTTSQTATLKKAMEQSVLFKGLDSRDFEILFKAFEQEHFQANWTIFDKGDEGDKFYLIEEGRCQIIVPELEGTSHGSIFVGEGDTFGELGVMYGTPRAATIVTTVSCRLWWIDRDTYRGTLMNQMQRKRDRYMDFLENVEILETLEPYEKARIADVLEVEEMKQNDIVVNEGDQGDKFFILEEGEVSIEKGGKHVGQLKNGDFFGELALLFGRPRAATITIVSKTARLVSLTRANFVNYLGPLEEKLRRNTERYKQFLGKNTKGKEAL